MISYISKKSKFKIFNYLTPIVNYADNQTTFLKMNNFQLPEKKKEEYIKLHDHTICQSLIIESIYIYVICV